MEGYPIQIDEPFKLRARDPLTITLSMVDAIGASVDLNGFGASWYSTLRYADLSQTGVDLTVDITSGIVSGKLTYIVLELSDDRSATLDPDHHYVFDVEARAGDGTPRGVWRGQIATLPAVTRG